MSGPSFSAPPRRQAAKKAMSSMADQLSDSDTNPDSDSSPYKAPTLNKAAGKVKSKAKTTRPPASGKLRSKAPPASRDGTTTAIGATSTARPASRKRKLEAAGLANSGGDANAHAMDASSPLSSPGSFTFSPPKRRRHCSAHSSETSTSSAPALSTRPGLARFESSSLVLAELFGPSLKGKGKASASGHMDAKGLGKHAFVLLDAEGNVSEEGTVWWPAEVTRTISQPAMISRVSLLGENPGPPQTSIPISSLTASIIQSLRTKAGSYRFSASTFQIKPPLDMQLAERWRCAMDQLVADGDQTETEDDYESDDLELPSRIYPHDGTLPSELLHSLPTSSDCGSNQGSKTLSRQDTPEVDPNVDLDNGGGYVLATHGKGKEYWPARTTAFDTASGKYVVQFFDTVEAQLPRSAFYIPGEEGFVTCQLGKIGTEEPLDDRTDENNEDALSAERARMLSVLSAPPPGGAPTNLYMLHMTEQFPYVVPVLRTILEGMYVPAREAHDDFMAGGSRRASLARTTRTYGDLTDRQKSALDRVLAYWLFGDEDSRQLAAARRCIWDFEDDKFRASHDPPPSSLEYSPSTSREGFRPRLCGGEDYESLSDLERREYFANVLKPEACYQLLLWQKGKRTKLEVQHDEEEHSLRAVALQLAAEPDVVVAIRDLRRLYAGGRLAGSAKVDPASATGGARTGRRSGGTRSRPLR